MALLLYSWRCYVCARGVRAVPRPSFYIATRQIVYIVIAPLACIESENKEHVKRDKFEALREL